MAMIGKDLKKIPATCWNDECENHRVIGNKETHNKIYGNTNDKIMGTIKKQKGLSLFGDKDSDSKLNIFDSEPKKKKKFDIKRFI